MNILFNLDIITPFVFLLAVRKFNIITYLVLVQGVLNVIAFALAKNHIHNIFIYQINIVISVYIIERFFKRKNYVFVPILIAAIFESRDSFNSLSWCAGSFIIIFYSILYFISKVKYYSAKRLTDDSEFWYASGLLFYYLGSFTIFLVYSFRTVMELDITSLWELNNILYLIMCVYFFVGIKNEKYTK